MDTSEHPQTIGNITIFLCYPAYWRRWRSHEYFQIIVHITIFLCYPSYWMRWRCHEYHEYPQNIVGHMCWPVILLRHVGKIFTTCPYWHTCFRIRSIMCVLDNLFLLSPPRPSRTAQLLNTKDTPISTIRA